MKNQINFYCDESRHIERDRSLYMILGSVICNQDNVNQINERIKEIKRKHNINPFMEAKWSKISSSNYKMYEELINYFFDCNMLSFRGIIIDKSKINHRAYKSSHEDFYYKMYYQLLKIKLSQLARNKIYLDEKDTHNAKRVNKFQTILKHELKDYNSEIIRPIQVIKSHTIQIMSLTDIFCGALSYQLNIEDKKSLAKIKLIKLIEEKTKCKISKLKNFLSLKYDLFFFKSKKEI